MTLMLASVTGPEEAETAIAGGADIIDLKDPARGALGAVEPEVVRRSVAAIGGRRLVSAVAGVTAHSQKGMAEIAQKTAASTVRTSLIMLIATRMARMQAMIRLIITMMFIPRAWMIAALKATESAASCIRSR